MRLTIKKNEMGGACSTYGERESVYGVLVGKLARKRQLGRRRRRYKNNINIDLQKVVLGEWIISSWHRKGTGGELL